MSLRISLKYKCVRYSQYFSGFAGVLTSTVICFKESAVKVKQVATAWLYSTLLTAKLHCRQYKESTSLCDKVVIVLEEKVALTMAKLAVLQ